MDSVLMITISTLVLAIILIVITIAVIKGKQSKKYKKEIEELDIEKNSLLGVPVLSEITKVKELIKTDNLKEKLNDWDNTFKYIRDEKIPELTDSISDADFLIDRKEYKQAIKKIADVEMELRLLKNKTDVLLEEIKLITNSEERNRTLITKLKIVYREQQAKFDRSKKEYGDVAPYIEDEFDSIDKLFADFEKAIPIIIDSKTQYVSACNAVETLLIHKDIINEFVPKLHKALQKHHVELRGSEKIVELTGCNASEEADNKREYLDYIVSAKEVEDVKAAVEHINHYGSHHTDCIITENKETAEYFMRYVDSAGVYQNCSTRFADGYRYGFGAEVGISTSKIHARGPVGLEGLVSYKYKLYGHGDIVDDYATGKKQFKFKDL